MNNKYLVENFMSLVRIDSESQNEGAFQKALAAEFKKLDLRVYEDNTKEKTGLGAGNLVCVLDGNTNKPPLLFCCHSDTVTPGKGIEPVIHDGSIYSAGETILAADDKAGIAVLLEMVSQIKKKNLKHGKIELLFTVGEEVGLIGMKAFDVAQLESKKAYVFDSAGPIGGITMASPSMYTMDVTFLGRAAHAGVEPEKGISAIEMAAMAINQMPFGRIDEITTTNIGTIHGGTATNIVADEVKITLEVRSISDQRCEEILDEIINVIEDTVNKMGGAFNYETIQRSQGYKLTENCYTARLAKEAFTASGREINYQTSGGASDANILNERGIETANLAVGYEKIHTVDEFIPIEEMEKALEVALYLVANHH